MGPQHHIQPVEFGKVRLNDHFWQRLQRINTKNTIPHNIKKCEETDRIENFEIAAGRKTGEFKGIRFNDSDVFKVMEAAAHSLVLFPDPELESYLDNLIDIVGDAQEKDGYIYTIRTINSENLSDKSAGTQRWSFLKESHELYNIGHMYEAAAAYFQATGKWYFLDIACKSADLTIQKFGLGEGMLHDPPGHPEIELGLIKLYRATGEQKYLDQAKIFLELRGRADLHALYGAPHNPLIFQDHKPVKEQTSAVGHSVRACYLYAAMAEVAAITGNKEYEKAVKAIWEDIASTKMALTGGIGASRHGEKFAKPYILPNLTAYNETCAAIAFCFFSYRMFLLTGEAKYIDILERILYNGFLAGVGFDGLEYFYPNPLESDGIYKFNQGHSATRNPWFNCSCCPTNIARFIPQIGELIYAYDINKRELFINLFIESSTEFDIGEQKIVLNQITSYPWDGHIEIEVQLHQSMEATIALRTPSWTQGRPVPGNLYGYESDRTTSPNIRNSITLNGEAIDVKPSEGYIKLKRTWKSGDKIRLNYPMDVKRVVGNKKIFNLTNLVAFERGPIVYCAESYDNDGSVMDIIIPNEFYPSINKGKGILKDLTIIQGEARTRSRTLKERFHQKYGKMLIFRRLSRSHVIASRWDLYYQKVKLRTMIKKQKKITLIPYYAWSNRGEGEMAVWFPKE